MGTERTERTERTCPLCGQKYTEAPALSRTDNRTPICPECGTRQALDAIPESLMSSAEKDEIMEAIYPRGIVKMEGRENGHKAIRDAAEQPMAGFPSREEVEELRKQYPPGTRVVLDECSDPFREMPGGMEGVVTGVDDAGQLHAKWQNGSSLAMVYGVDRYHRKE